MNVPAPGVGGEVGRTLNLGNEERQTRVAKPWSRWVRAGSTLGVWNEPRTVWLPSPPRALAAGGHSRESPSPLPAP